MNQFAQLYAQFRQNPLAMLSKKFNIPQNLNDPQQIVQHLLNSNQISQSQVNMYVSQASNNPFLRQFMNR